MDTSTIIATIQEFAFVLGTFGFFVLYAIVRGRQATINLILGLYLALLISMVFPYYQTLVGEDDSSAWLAIGIFSVFTLIGTFLITRLMPDEYREKKFETFHKKLMLAIGGTILILVFSFNILPVGDIIDVRTPFQSLFSSSEFFFWWLLVPFVFLYLN